MEIYSLQDRRLQSGILVQDEYRLSQSEGRLVTRESAKRQFHRPRSLPLLRPASRQLEISVRPIQSTALETPSESPLASGEGGISALEMGVSLLARRDTENVASSFVAPCLALDDSLTRLLKK